MAANYWGPANRNRISRRRLLGSAAAGTAAAAFLAACGGDKKKTGESGSASTGLLAKPVDTFEKAVRGGVLKEYVSREAQTLDPAAPVGPLNDVAKYPFGTLLAEKVGYMEPSKREMKGDLAESWEFSPDKLQITLKLRQGVKWHNKAPVNGRTVDIDDVLFAWKRFISLSPYRDVVVNSVNPASPVLSFTATDPSTIVIKLKEPLSYILTSFAAFGSVTGNIVMLPKEADGGYDPRGDMIGHGPYMLAKATPSVGYSFKKNPDYYDKDAALVDQIEMPLVIEYAARLAQLKAGNIHRLFGPDPRAEDVYVIKSDEPRLQVFQTDFGADGTVLIFGQLPQGNSPFLDERVRRAVSMGIDRNAWLDAIFNISALDKRGLPVESRWNSHLLATWEGYWLDPQSSEFGPNGKNFQLNVAEAKKQLAAAGYADGLNVLSNYPADRVEFRGYAEPLDGMMADIGIKIKVNNPDYATQYIPKYRDGQGQYEGWSYASIASGSQDPVSAMASEYWSKAGGTFRGFSADKAVSKGGDPALDRMIEKARLEFDPKALKSQVEDIQRYLGGTMWGLNMPGGATGFSVAWPAVQNNFVWRGVRQNVSGAWNAYRVWLDKTQAPLA